MNQRLHRTICYITFALGPAIALAQSPPERDGLAVVAELEKTLVDAIAAAQPSVVAVARATPPQAQANGGPPAPVFVEVFGDLQQFQTSPQPETVAAGVIIDPAGLVLTEFLAVRQGDTHSVTLADGQTYPAEVKAADPRSGLAVLAIRPATQPANPQPISARNVEPRPGTPKPQEPPAPNPAPFPTAFPALRFGDAGQLRKGQFVIAIGNPYAIRSDGEPTASWGIVANLARKAPPGTNFNDAPGPVQDYRTSIHHLGTLIQTDARLGWSAGGGALVNLRGELIGLTTTAATIAGHEQPAGYAIPINATFRRIIDTLKEGREVEYGLLGINLGTGIPVGGNLATPRVLVQHAFAGSPGDLAGLKAGDVILAVGGEPVRNVDDLQLNVSSQTPSSEMTVEYSRGGITDRATVKLAKLAVAGNKIVTNRTPAWRGIRVDYATALDAVKLTGAFAAKTIDPAGCVLVADVEADSVAAKAGIEPGMFISHVGSERVRTPDEFYAAARKLGEAGETLDIKLTQPITVRDRNPANGENPDGGPPQP